MQIISLVLWHFLEHDLNTWTDPAVETRDHVNLMYSFAFFFVRNMFLDFSFEMYVAR